MECRVVKKRNTLKERLTFPANQPPIGLQIYHLYHNDFTRRSFLIICYSLWVGKSRAAEGMRLSLKDGDNN